MSRPTPWDDIGVPTTDYTVRRVAASGDLPLFWGRDTSARCLLIVELEGEHAEAYRAGAVSIHGISVDLRDGEDAEHQRLVLSLDREVDKDVFLGLCETLIATLQPVSDPDAALLLSLAHIRRWKAFFAGRKARVLGPEEVRGLFAELHFLRALYSRRLTQAQAVDGWCGIENVHQDFIFSNTAVEVKSLIRRDRSTVRISSEDQLETVADELFLAVHRLSEGGDDTAALSLNEMVLAIEQELDDSDALEQFSAKLADFGYLPVSDYDNPRFIVSGRQMYRVEEGFPRLVRSGLPQGIARLSYEIELEAIRSFECAESEVLGA